MKIYIFTLINIIIKIYIDDKFDNNFKPIDIYPFLVLTKFDIDKHITAEHKINPKLSISNKYKFKSKTSKMKIITDFIDNTVGGPGLGTQNTHESNSNSSNNGNGLRPLAGSDITGSVNNTHRPDFGPEPTNDKIEKIKADLKIKIQELLHILDGQNIRILH